MLRIAARAALALGSSVLGVAAVGTPRPAGESAASVPVEGLPFAPCGLMPVPLPGAIEVQGAPVRAAVAWTAAAPDEVIACERRHFDPLPVDLQSLPGALVVRDNLGGRTLIVSARRVAAGSTEVVLGEQRGAGRAVAPPRDLPLPPELVVTTRVDDRAGASEVTTYSGVCRGEPASLLAAVEARLAGAGWRRVAVPEGGRVFASGGRSLVFALAGGATCTFSLRLLAEAP